MCERTLLNSQMPVILKQRVMEMRQVIPIVNSLDNPALKETHWGNVGIILNKPVPMVETKGKDPNAPQEGEIKAYITIRKPEINIAWLVEHQALI